MDLENLTRHQIILLTLLVSFVTSIATGIVTVSLMNQAPPSVTRTINQIVEHTVQTVMPASPQRAAVVTTQKTIVVKDDDLAAQSIAAVQKSIIRITAKGGDELIARGVVVGNTTAITDKETLENSGAVEFEAILSTGERVSLALRATKATSTPFAVVTILGTSTGFAASPLADVSKLRLGQSVLRISGKGVDSVGEGVIAMLPGSVGLIESSVQSSIPGSVLVTRFGEVVGLTTALSLETSSAQYSIISIPAPMQTSDDPKQTSTS